MWYVWPSLFQVRSNVRHPQFLLPDFSAVLEYLKDDVLSERLVDITHLARKHLQIGTSPEKLFGKQYKYDLPKFREAMTVFAVAARSLGFDNAERTFRDGLHALGSGPDE